MRMISVRSRVALAVLFLAACDDDALGPSSTVESVAVIPGSFSLAVGDTLRLSTIARGDIGNPLLGRSIAWESSAPSVASISATGLVTGVGAGAAIITATIEGKTGSTTATVSLMPGSVTFASVVTGGAHSCALTSSGAAYCWGRGESGQLGVPAPVTTCLGDQALSCSLVPLPVNGGLQFQHLTGGGSHTCGLTTGGSAWCWGRNAFGQLGDGSFTSRDVPVAVATAVKFESIDAGLDHTCGLTTAGEALCWGRNSAGQLGDGTVTRREVPVPVSLPDGTTIRVLIASGSRNGFSCALAATGEAWCWGGNDTGQLGRGAGEWDGDPHPLPELVSGGLTFTAITAGLGEHVCALSDAGAAFCWGYNSSGALGVGSRTPPISPVPMPVSGGLTFTQVVTGGQNGYTCGLTSNGVAYCWGDNVDGTVGDGSTAVRFVPTAVAGGLTFASMDAGLAHTCGRTTTGTLYCWGSGRTGQLGVNSRTSSPLPLKVIGQL